VHFDVDFEAAVGAFGEWRGWVLAEVGDLRDNVLDRNGSDFCDVDRTPDAFGESRFAE
jgi:hypothetical protein